MTNPVLDDLQKYYEGAIKAPMNYTDPSQIREYIGGKGKNIYDINMENIPETFMNLPTDFPASSRFGEKYTGAEELGVGQVSPYKLFGEEYARGGRVNFSEGGIVGLWRELSSL